MKENNIKIVINGLTKQYGYLLEDIRSVDSNFELWTLNKDISGVQYRLIFMTEHSLNQLKQYDISENRNNIYILFAEDEFSMEKDTQTLSINNLAEKPTI